MVANSYNPILLYIIIVCNTIESSFRLYCVFIAKIEFKGIYY